MLSSVKASMVKELQDKFERMSSAVFVDFQGMSVEEVTTLRDAFRAQGVEYKVVKNTLIKQALGERSRGLGDALRGMTGVAWSYEEPSAAARVLKQFRRDNEKLKIKAALLEGQVITAVGVEDELAALPNKGEARARLLATLMAPAQRFVMLLSAPAQHLVGVLAAKQRQSEG